ncbi:MAG: hypothetical protein E7235_02950 [Lachnospiraceae bacterium]|nr:hypothetical protein [Lachnospiraceae bacterium]
MKENTLVELKNTLLDLRRNDRKPFYIAIAVLSLVAIGLGALVFFIIKNKKEDEEYIDECDWEDYEDFEDDCECGCCECEEQFVDEVLETEE